MTTRVLLADDHTLVRAGVRKLLESMSDIEVVGEAEDGLAVLALAAQLKPDLVLMDISMPGINGLDATVQLRKAQPEAAVIILSMHQNEEYVRQALRHGASGYLLKDAAPMELDLAIRAVRRGNTYLSPAISQGVLNDYVERLRREDHPSDNLTPRQREVLQLVVQGYSTKEIARHLNLAVKTVDTHRTQLMKQLDVHDVTGLVRYAIRRGLISAEN